MKVEVGKRIINILLGDITQERVDAIVSTANSRLTAGNGVESAVQRAGGPRVQEELKTRHPKGCPTGSAVHTSAGLVPARIMIHAVGPRWNNGEFQEAEQLRNCYLACLKIASDFECHTVAFTPISIGYYGYPVAEGAQIALQAALEFESPNDFPVEIRFVVYSKDVFDQFTKELTTLVPE
jgi:O-acetyl-ADP-ribose deacetylase (regulator of RNase III)